MLDMIFTVPVTLPTSATDTAKLPQAGTDTLVTV